VTAGPQAPLSVMSYNIQGHGALLGRRYLEGIARVIRRARPRVVGLQEVHRGTWAARFDDQVAILAELTGMRASFGRSLSLRTGEYGNALLFRGRLLEEEVSILPGEAERRSILRCRILPEGPGLAPAGLASPGQAAPEPLDVFVTHLAAWGRLGRSTRVRQARFVADRLHEADGSFVLTGDLNAPPAAPELAPLMAHARLRACGGPGAGPGAGQGAGQGDGQVATHRFLRQRIDYVFAGPGWRRVGARVLRTGPSDHYPVLATLWPGERPAGAPAAACEGEMFDVGAAGAAG
jgi:endonuclease/exonuclease/phosphatase family metal-dependent hydrolase